MDVPCRTKNVNKYYKVIAEVGSGTYGKVYKAECLKTNDFVALKKIDTKDSKIMAEGFPITAIREIKLLKIMSHKNIIRLREIIVSKASHRNNFRGSTFLVFDYYDHDFAGLHRQKNLFTLPQLKCIFKQLLEGVKYLHENKKQKNLFTLPQLKCIFKQLLEGVKYLHENKIIHRDLKCANLLMNNAGQVTLADFGLARTLSHQAKYTYKVVTLWYRAPELLLGQINYSTQIDMWSIGCIFAEILTGEILFKGDIEYRQFDKIQELCGSANEQSWPNCVNLRFYEEYKARRVYERQLIKHLKELNKNLDQYTLDLIDQLLALDPNRRLTAVQALNHEFFKQDPKPCQQNEMPKFDKEFHETLLKNEQKKKLERPYTQSKVSQQKSSAFQKIIKDDRQKEKVGLQKQESPKQPEVKPKEEFDLDDMLNEINGDPEKKIKI